MMPISQVTVNILRAYIADHGSRAMLDVAIGDASDAS